MSVPKRCLPAGVGRHAATDKPLEPDKLSIKDKRTNATTEIGRLWSDLRPRCGMVAMALLGTRVWPLGHGPMAHGIASQTGKEPALSRLNQKDTVSGPPSSIHRAYPCTAKPASLPGVQPCQQRVFPWRSGRIPGKLHITRPACVRLPFLPWSTACFAPRLGRPAGS
jgi:hypothetical protein